MTAMLLAPNPRRCNSEAARSARVRAPTSTASARREPWLALAIQADQRAAEWGTGGHNAATAVRRWTRPRISRFGIPNATPREGATGQAP